MKHEWKKSEKGLYLPGQNAVTIEVPRQKFFKIKGKGNPNDQAFSEKIEILYALSYSVRMMPKQGFFTRRIF